MSSHKGEKMDLFGGGDLVSLDNEIYGGQPNPEIPDSGRVVARPTSIMAIWADRKQPRRAIPSSIAMHWNGDPSEVPSMLRQWHLIAEQTAGVPIDVDKLLDGEGEGIDSDKFPSVAQEYLSLVRLAQGIKADGLINPITIVESDGRYLIESGERRWLAYHMLNTYLGDQWAKIPAAKGSGSDSVWRQATENTQRRQLNPIGMARQIALLIMAARGTPPIADGSSYQEYEDVVKAGVCDRRFYAQVADGNVHRIPKGMGERIQAAMGIGMEQLSQYRALLHLTNDEQINDVIWTRADIENWPEGWMREIRTLTPVKVSEVIQRPQWTIDDLRALKDAPVDRPPNVQQPQPVVMPDPAEWMGKHVRTTGGITGKVVDVYKDNISIRQDHDNQRATFKAIQLHFMPPPTKAPVTTTPSVTLEVGDTVKTRMGSVGVITSISGRLIILDVPRRGRMEQHAEHLTLVQRAGAAPQIDEANIEPDVDPDAPAPVREYSEGWTDGEGGNNQPQQTWIDEIASDKANSVTPTLLFPMGSMDWGFLDALNDLAVLSDNDATSEAINDLNGMTDAEAIRLHEAQALRPKLDEAFNQIQAAMDEWLNVKFVAILQQVMDAAE